MRLWSLHPSLLDAKGLVACWRESLLAKKVLEGNTKGYKNHSQLIRFKSYHNPLIAINAYLYELWYEASQRGYNFDKSKIDGEYILGKFYQIPCHTGQLFYEWNWLLKKIANRDKAWYDRIKDRSPIAHGLFELKVGPIEKWEKLNEDI